MFEDIHKKLDIINSALRKNYIACGIETLALSTASSTGLASIPTDARYAIIQINETTTSGSVDVIRYWQNGTDPTSTTGIVRGDRDAFDLITMENIKNFRVIRLTANAHVLQVQYFR